MIPDRFAPTLTIDQFFALIGEYGGYNELKQFGVSAVLAGQLSVASLLGLVYGLVGGQPSITPTMGPPTPTAPDPFSLPRERGSRPWWLIGGAVGLLWAVSLAILWPTLPTSFIGLPPSFAAPVTAIGLLGAYAA